CADELDRHLEQAFEALLHEVARVVVEQLARDDETALDGEAAETDRVAPQAERITGARRPAPRPERDVQVVDLVRRGEDPAALARRERGARRIREVVLLDRGAHRLGVAGEPRVLRADVALEVGELADELGRLVGLREPRRLARGVPAAEALDE